MKVCPPMLTDAGQLVGAVEGVAVRDRRRGGGHLPGGPGRVLALGGPVNGRGPILRAEQRVELRLGDAVDPHARVVVRVASHSHDPSGGGHHHGRALVGVIAGGPCLADGGAQRLLRVGLDSGIDAGDEIVTGLSRVAPRGPGDVPGRVDRDRIGARLAGELVVVLLLEPALPDEIRAGVPDPRRQVVRFQLLSGGRQQVTQDLSRVGTVRLLVFSNALGLRGHSRELVLLFHDLQCRLVADVLVYRYRLIGRTGPARLGHCGAAQPHLLLQELVRHVEHGSEAMQHGGTPVRLLGQGQIVDGDHQRGALGHQGVAHVVQDLPAHGRDDNVPGLVRRRQLHVAGAVHHLDVPEPPAQSDQ